WCRIMANVLGVRVELPESEEGPGMGAAMLAMVAAGEYNSVKEVSDALVKVRRVIEPEEGIALRYEDRYRQFRTIYPALKEVFRTIN
ncbi:MAG: FGGY-family carbohydrate kinase, partial [Lachnospira sp.]|nr:FGGY-family carbohydrate kinase [Lachnospira sp.]